MCTHRYSVAASVLTLVASASLLGACGAEPVPSASRVPSQASAGSPAGPVALLGTASGITAVEAGTTRTVWSEPGAVSALDGSAVFTRSGSTLVRLDPETGDPRGSWPIDAALTPVVVAPGGRWVALTDRNADDSYATDAARERTTLVVLNGSTGAELRRFALSGRVEPEAFSPDGARLIVLDHRDSTYRVQTLDLATGDRYDTVDENKDPLGDMTGHRVRGVLSEDGTVLATLYQHRGGPEATAFVHVLDLNGWTYCVPLPAPFGSGPGGSVVIERAGDDVIVISDHADQRARFSLARLRQLGTAATEVAVTQGAGQRADAPYLEVPGYRALIATL